MKPQEDPQKKDVFPDDMSKGFEIKDRQELDKEKKIKMPDWPLHIWILIGLLCIPLLFPIVRIVEVVLARLLMILV